jgi:uncharacterized membrane protein
MNPLAAFLARYKDLRPPTEATQKLLAEAMQAKLGVEVPLNKIEIRRKTAFIQGSSALKSELSLREKEIILYVREKGGAVDELR